jgi:hypothetical protein
MGSGMKAGHLKLVWVGSALMVVAAAALFLLH